MSLDKLADAGANLINAAAGNTEVIKSVYDDAVKPVAQEAGKAVLEPVKGATRIGRVINALFSEIDIWVLNREYSLNKTRILLEKKLENISEDKITTPPHYVLVPALQAISISMDSDELRNMYANLLARSMCSDTTDKAHPSYVEIIRQLSPLDCCVIEYIFKNDLTLAVSIVRIKNQKIGMLTEYSEVITEIDFADVKTISASLDNLKRLGLIQEGKELFDRALYERIHENIQVKEFCKRIELYDITNPEEEKFEYEHKRVNVTDFGELFYDVCCKDMDE